MVVVRGALCHAFFFLWALRHSTLPPITTTPSIRQIITPFSWNNNNDDNNRCTCWRRRGCRSCTPRWPPTSSSPSSGLVCLSVCQPVASFHYYFVRISGAVWLVWLVLVGRLDGHVASSVWRGAYLPPPNPRTQTPNPDPIPHPKKTFTLTIPQNPGGLLRAAGRDREGHGAQRPQV